MEYSIDRSSYRRRANIEVEEKETPKIVYKILRRLFIQSIAGILVLLAAYTVKIMKLQSATEWLKREVNRDIPIDVAYNQVKTSAMKMYHQFFAEEENTNLISPSDTEIDSNSDIVQNEVVEQILSVNTEDNEEIIFEEAVEGINQMSEDASFIKSNYKFIYPIQGTVTSRFGVRVSDNPIVTAYHSGVDLAANTGTKIQAALGGKVILATTNESYGKHIMIQTDDVIIVYAHCSKLNVKEGQEVKQGTVIGEVGSTGWATGPHLHFEIRYNDRLVNPADILDFGE